MTTIRKRSPKTFEKLTQNGVRREAVSHLFGGARRTLCAFQEPARNVGASEELARTTEPDSAGQSRVPGSLEGRVGPVRAVKHRVLWEYTSKLNENLISK